MGRTEVIRVPSHVDIEGNKRADTMAKEGVKKHGQKMRDEKREEEAKERKGGKGQVRVEKYPEKFPP